MEKSRYNSGSLYHIEYSLKLIYAYIQEDSFGELRFITCFGDYTPLLGIKYTVLALDERSIYGREAPLFLPFDGWKKGN